MLRATDCERPYRRHLGGTSSHMQSKQRSTNVSSSIYMMLGLPDEQDEDIDELMPFTKSPNPSHCTRYRSICSQKHADG